LVVGEVGGSFSRASSLSSRKVLQVGIADWNSSLVRVLGMDWGKVHTSHAAELT
jgi:hypothetical protein